MSSTKHTNFFFSCFLWFIWWNHVPKHSWDLAFSVWILCILTKTIWKFSCFLLKTPNIGFSRLDQLSVSILSLKIYCHKKYSLFFSLSCFRVKWMRKELLFSGCSTYKWQVPACETWSRESYPNSHYGRCFGHCETWTLQGSIITPYHFTTSLTFPKQRTCIWVSDPESCVLVWATRIHRVNSILCWITKTKEDCRKLQLCKYWCFLFGISNYCDIFHKCIKIWSLNLLIQLDII